MKYQVIEIIGEGDLTEKINLSIYSTMSEARTVAHNLTDLRKNAKPKRVYTVVEVED